MMLNVYTPSGDLERGARFTQEDIEAAFDTGFGYYIKGINPRCDDDNDRYLLLFANKDGPHSDSVTHGRFEYIGEGLEGDQSEGSPGNSALIDAVSSDFPVFFFYTQAESEEWEYQEQVDVIGYQQEQRDGRQVLVFEIEHKDNSSETTDSTGSSTPGLYPLVTHFLAHVTTYEPIYEADLDTDISRIHGTVIPR